MFLGDSIEILSGVFERDEEFIFIACLVFSDDFGIAIGCVLSPLLFVDTERAFTASPAGATRYVDPEPPGRSEGTFTALFVVAFVPEYEFDTD